MKENNLSDLPPEPAPTLRLNIDRDALAANWRALDGLSGQAAAGAAVKANGYGLGSGEVAAVLRAAGARNFFVAHWGEVGAVLAQVPAGEISVLHGALQPQDAAFAQASGVRPTINSLYQARLWLDAGGGACDLMVDTGMNRLGLSMDEIGDDLVRALQVDVLLSHLASADEESALNVLQLRRFAEASAAIPSRRRSLANSAGIALGPDYHFDLTRPGIALYGGVPRGELDGVIRQVAFPQAALIQCRNIHAGDTVGYNATFTAAWDMRVGVASIGYADGFLRAWSSNGDLTHGDRLLPILGRVSMDMVVVDLSAAPDLGEGDWLDVPYHLPDAARISGLSQYELLTVLGQRFAR